MSTLDRESLTVRLEAEFCRLELLLGLHAGEPVEQGPAARCR